MPAIVTTFQLLGVFSSLWTVDRFGRRPVLVRGSIVVSVLSVNGGSSNLFVLKRADVVVLDVCLPSWHHLFGGTLFKTAESQVVLCMALRPFRASVWCLIWSLVGSSSVDGSGRDIS